MAPNQLFDAGTMNAPWGLASRLKLVVLACEFFNATKIASSHELLGKSVPSGRNPEPLTVSDFLKFLEVSDSFAKTPNAFRVMEIINCMVSTGLLVPAGQGTRSFAGLSNHYLYLLTESEAQRDLFRLVPALGPEFLYRLTGPGLVHITGKNEEGDVVAGTGIVIHPSHVLTCCHVVTDMQPDSRQTFQGNDCAVESIQRHPEVDVATIRIKGSALAPLSGIMFQAPVVAQTVYTLGYPKLPSLKDASVTMQPGAVTNESVTSISGERLFLYSAISRPGNSGGPVMSEDGYVLGLSVVDVAGQYQGHEAFSPHYAGIPAQVIVEAVKDLGVHIELPFRHFE